jgi:hypothetical protein
MAEGKTSPWVWIGCGCLLALFLIVAVIGGMIFMGVSWVRNVEETMSDPVKRTERVREILDTDELPEGYNAIAAMSVPLFADVAILGTNEPDAEGRVREMGDRGFIYMRMKLAMGQKEQELRDFLEGKTDKAPDIVLKSNIRMDTEDVVKRGTMELEDSTVVYSAYRGDIDVEHKTGRGLASMAMIQCPDDHRIRLCIWFGPDPSQGGSLEEADLSGTPADEAALADFLSHFAFCN